MKNWHHKIGNIVTAYRDHYQFGMAGSGPLGRQQRSPGQAGWTGLAGPVLRGPSLSLSASVLSDSTPQFLPLCFFFFPSYWPYHSYCKTMWTCPLKWQKWCLHSSLKNTCISGMKLSEILLKLSLFCAHVQVKIWINTFSLSHIPLPT